MGVAFVVEGCPAPSTSGFGFYRGPEARSHYEGLRTKEIMVAAKLVE